MIDIFTRLISEEIRHVLHDLNSIFVMRSGGIDSPFETVLFWMPLNTEYGIPTTWRKSDQHISEKLKEMTYSQWWRRRFCLLDQD